MSSPRLYKTVKHLQSRCADFLVPFYWVSMPVLLLLYRLQ